MPETINTIGPMGAPMEQLQGLCWKVAMEVAKPSLVYPPLSYAHQQVSIHYRAQQR